MATVIDLISPEKENATPNLKRTSPSKQRRKEKCPRIEQDKKGHEVVCLDFSDDEGEGVLQTASVSTAVACLNPSLSTVTDSSTEGTQKDVKTAASGSTAVAEVETVAPPEPARWKTSEDDELKEGDDDEDVAILGATAPNALEDFPHSRENCVAYPFAQDPSRHCPNCYCYVCDIHASDCKTWQTHCQAKHSDRRWQKLRQDHRTRGGIPQQATAPTVPRPVAAARPAPPAARWAAPRRRFGRAAPAPKISIHDLLKKVTSVHPVEVSPPAGTFQTNLRHYQKQSLAFMLDMERQTVGHEVTRGGWLADEVGMGKTAAILALICSNPMENPPSMEQISSHCRQGKSDTKLKVKPTVITTSVSLLGQWEDEIMKDCPSITFKRYHGKSQNLSERDLYGCDVIISTTTFEWSDWITKKFEFHRYVVDESHLFVRNTSSARLDFAQQISSYLKWCVTATPCTGSPSDIHRQLHFLNATGSYLHNESLVQAIRKLSSPVLHNISTNDALDNLADVLKQCMIRHTKSQRINGSAALALPASSTVTVLLNMTTQERHWFLRSASGYDIQRAKTRGANTFHLERRLLFSMKDIPSNAQLTKVTALARDLHELGRQEPSFRVVVFTQYLRMHEACVKELRGRGFTTFEFKGSSSAKKRDEAIRSFQNQTSQNPAVFVITMRAGSVGITLTAASRVYLMEPCLDPAVEVQAAGRIHRLGQTKQVQVKKLVFRNSIETNIVELHREIAAGRIAVTNGFFPPEAVQILARGR